MNFSVFNHISQTTQGHIRNMEWVVERIRSGTSGELIRKIRSESDKEKRNELKKSLASICFSGVFRKRTDNGITSHSGYMVADFDHVKDMDALRTTLEADPYTCVLFTSPSGDGLKMVVRVPPNIKEHRGRFRALMEYLDNPDFDPKNGNPSRVCYESIDPDIYYNPESKVFEDIVQHEPLDFAVDRPMVRLHSEDRIIARLVLWSERNHPITDGQRNQNVFKLASAMNRCGVAKVTAMNFLRQYAQDGFGIPEIDKAVASGYKDISVHGTHGFNDEDTEFYIRQRNRDGAMFDDISKEVTTKIPDKVERDETIERVINDVDGTIFWSKSKKGVVAIDHYKFKKFLQEYGFRKLYPAMGTTYVFVRVEENLITNTSDNLIKDFVMRYIEETGDRQVFNYLAGKKGVFKEDYLDMLDPIGIEFVSDQREYGTLFYRNCAVRVHKGGRVEEIDYVDLGGYVWRDHIIDRDFVRDECKDGDFNHFVNLISANDPERIKAHRTTFGYLIHGYKDLSDNRAVIYNDCVINDSPNGGSGKGIICQALSKVRRMCVLDGKSFSFDKGFPYQTVSADCQLLNFDDVPKHFQFVRLFSVITEGIVLEKKNKDAVKIGVQKSPKIIINTNYTVEGDGGSHDRRKWNMELSDHFGVHHTPMQEFGHPLFEGGWDPVQWRRFDNYMVNSLAMYLNEGLYECAWQSLHIRSFIGKTSTDFWYWLEEGRKFNEGDTVYRAEEMQKFVNEYPDWSERGKYKLTAIRWKHWLDAYGAYRGWQAIDQRNQQGHYTKYVAYEEAQGVHPAS